MKFFYPSCSYRFSTAWLLKETEQDPLRTRNQLLLHKPNKLDAVGAPRRVVNKFIGYQI